MKLSTFFLLWVFGFFLLLSFDLFVEAFVFEWLSWNGTDKNDWFFCFMVGLGCGLGFVWLSKTLLNMEHNRSRLIHEKTINMLIIFLFFYNIGECHECK
ncbi:hypothetical protein N9340_00680 [Gammaproteobacteria bacterium]|nr:hypothetical protein [Gammaproteobacteria bacterium]